MALLGILTVLAAPACHTCFSGGAGNFKPWRFNSPKRSVACRSTSGTHVADAVSNDHSTYDLRHGSRDERVYVLWRFSFSKMMKI